MYSLNVYLFILYDMGLIFLSITLVYTNYAWPQMTRRTTCRVVGPTRLISNSPLRRDVAPFVIEDQPTYML